MEYRPLGSTGLQVSALSLGGAAIGQHYGPISLADARATVQLAIDQGINFIDTSAYYGEGQSERMLGEILADGLRSRVLLGTKAGRLAINQFDFTPGGFRESVENSLRRLRTDHVDVLLAHDIEFAENLEQVFTDTAATLHALKREGKARFVGMSGLPLTLLRQAIERCHLDVVMSYAHYHLQNQALFTDLLPVAEAHGVGVFNASPLALGMLTHAGPQPWHPADADTKAACARAAAFCAERGADIAALGMRFALAEPRISSVVTGTARASELRANLAALDSPLDRDLLAAVQEILRPVMNRSWPSGREA